MKMIVISFAEMLDASFSVNLFLMYNGIDFFRC
jgi:hypothetical protein